MPDRPSFREIVAELDALSPRDREAVLSRLTEAEQNEVRRRSDVSAQPSSSPTPVQPGLERYSPWLREILQETAASDDQPVPRLMPAARAVLHRHLSGAAASVRASAKLAGSAGPGSSSLLQVAGGFLRGKKPAL